MPLAAPVITATLSARRARRAALAAGSLDKTLFCKFMDSSFPVGGLELHEVVVDDLAELEGEVGDDVRPGHDLEHRQLGERRQGVREQGELGRPGPRSLQIDVAEIVLDQLADARRAVDGGDDLEQKFWRQQGSCVDLYRSVAARVRLEKRISFARTSASTRLRGGSPCALQRSIWKASVSRRGRLSSTHCRGVLETMPPSQKYSPSISVAGKPGGSEPLAMICAGGIRWGVGSKQTKFPVRTLTAPTLRRVPPSLMRSKSTRRSSVAFSGDTS